jgi:hypothetical protein
MIFPESRGIIPPEQGWEERTWYLVEVSYTCVNPVHRSLFYSGFLNGNYPEKGKPFPGGYNCLVPLNGGGNNDPIQRIYYLKVLKKLFTNKEIESESF